MTDGIYFSGTGEMGIPHHSILAYFSMSSLPRKEDVFGLS